MTAQPQPEPTPTPEDPRGSAADSVNVRSKPDEPQSGEKIWTESELAALPLPEFERLQSEIDKAFIEGRVKPG